MDFARTTVRQIGVFALALAAIAGSSAAHSKLYVFGDSLSDNGNINKVTLGVEPGNEYYAGRFSNGPVWTEWLGYRLGKAPGLLSYDPFITSRVDGYNFAHGGAAAVERWFLPDFLEAPAQASYYARQVRKGRMSASAGDVATLWIGGNDYLNYDEGSVPTVVNGVMKSLRTVDSTGVGRIVLMNMPSLGEIPGEIGGPDRAKLNTKTLQHNNLLNKEVAAFKTTARSQIVQVDTYAMFRAVRQGAGGFTVVKPGDRGSATGTCKGDGLLLAACPTNYFFYDGVHPTVTGHRFIAGVVRDRLAAPIAATARLALGEAAAMPTVTAQLNQVKSRLTAAPDADGAKGYAFSSGDAGMHGTWSKGFGADWRGDGVTFGVTMAEGENAASLAETGAMSASAETLGYAAYAGWRAEGLSAGIGLTRVKTDQDFRRQTEIEGLPFASGKGETSATALQLTVAQEFADGAWTFRPEAAAIWLRTDHSAFAETGTMGLSDNLYDARSAAGMVGQAGVTLTYAEQNWGASLQAFGAANLGGQTPIWLAAPADVVSKSVALDTKPSAFGAGAWLDLWLVDAGGVNLTAGGGAFSDMQRTETAARVSMQIQF
jgi:phospholipase/lecithinase/hemolysin